MTIKGVIWDFDGTMSLTGKRQYLWFQEWARQNGKPLAYEGEPLKENGLTLIDKGEQLDTFLKFMTFYNIVIRAKDPRGVPTGPQGVYDAVGLPCDMNDKTHRVWIEYEKYKNEHPAGLYPGITEALLLFERAGLKQSINTTNKIASIEKELQRAGVRDVFCSIITEETLADYHGAGNQEAIKKPSKISLSLALEELGLPGIDVVHVGDTVNDLAASKRVMRLNPRRFEDIYTVGMTYGFEGRAVLEKGVETKEGTLHFDALADNAEGLVEIVKGLL